MRKDRIRTVAAACAAALLICGTMTGTAAAEAVTEATTEAATEAVSESSAAVTELTGNENILLIGSDRRDTTWNGNSDTMILMTINHDVDKIFLTSFMRDLWAEVPGQGTRKLNNAYAVGGAELLEETLVNCYGVHIDHYAAVDFTGIEDIIDALGGVDIEVTDAEAKVSNDYIKALANARNLNPEDYYITGGMQHLNGIQALGYMRDRYVGDNDFERTNRQRKVLMTLASSFDFSDLAHLGELKDQIMGSIDTDMSTIDIALMMTEIPTIKNYEIVSDRIPYDGMWYSSNEILVPDMPATIEKLTSSIYATEETEASTEE